MAKPEYYHKYNRKLRRAVLAFLGNKCVQCGFSDWRALQVDHINGGGCQEQKKIGPQAIYRRVLAGEPGYQLLCANCNFIKRYTHNELGGKQRG